MIPQSLKGAPKGQCMFGVCAEKGEGHRKVRLAPGQAILGLRPKEKSPILSLFNILKFCSP